MVYVASVVVVGVWCMSPQVTILGCMYVWMCVAPYFNRTFTFNASGGHFSAAYSWMYVCMDVCRSIFQ